MDWCTQHEIVGVDSQIKIIEFKYIYTYMDKLSEKILGMINNGQSAIDISVYFGGIVPMLNKTRQYPELSSVLRKKLSGTISGYFNLGAGELYEWTFPFIITSLDVEEDNHYYVNINVLIPELTSSENLGLVVSWLDEFLSDNGSETATFNDNFLNGEMCWVYLSHINGKHWNQFTLNKEIDDVEFLEILPDKYIS